MPRELVNRIAKPPVINYPPPKPPITEATGPTVQELIAQLQACAYRAQTQNQPMYVAWTQKAAP